jgi:ABC-type multidrug transport system fused ATPase/permease subunit
MVLALDALWFGVLILLLAIFCLAYLMSVRVWFALILVIIVVGLALTIVSMVNKRRKEKTRVVSDETMLLEYLKSHGIGGNLSELAQNLGIAEDKALKLLLSMEEQGAIPTGSTKALGASPPDTKKI